MSLAAAEKTADKIVRQGNLTKLWKQLGIHPDVLEAETHALRLGVPQFTEWYYAYNWYNKTMAASLQIIQVTCPVPQGDLSVYANFHKLFPTSEEFYYRAAYLIGYYGLVQFTVKIQKPLLQLWSLSQKNQFTDFQALFKSQSQTIKAIFGYSTGIGDQCRACVTLKFPVIDEVPHDCGKGYPSACKKKDKTFDCTICGTNFTTYDEVMKHVKDHNQACLAAAGVSRDHDKVLAFKSVNHYSHLQKNYDSDHGPKDMEEAKLNTNLLNQRLSEKLSGKGNAYFKQITLLDIANSHYVIQKDVLRLFKSQLWFCGKYRTYLSNLDFANDTKRRMTNEKLVEIFQNVEGAAYYPVDPFIMLCDKTKAIEQRIHNQSARVSASSYMAKVAPLPGKQKKKRTSTNFDDEEF